MKKNINNRILFTLIVVGFILLSCISAKNYLSPEGPKYSGFYAPLDSFFNDSLKIISFNIQFSEEIDRATWELNNYSELKNADIMLLQEMDEIGTEALAKKLKYNYIYYPATMHPQSMKNFGNAVLSKWPIQETKKIVLPHEVAVGKTRRIAVAADIKVRDIDVLVYSVHTATIVMSKDKRLSQADSVLNSLSAENRHVIIGGDFNTVFSDNIEEFEEIFAKHHFIRASKGAGTTVSKGPFDFTLDHIFCRGFEIIDSGKVESEASDHSPLWVTLKMQKQGNNNE